VTLRHTLRGHTGPIGRLAWSPDGRTLASPSADGTIRLWSAETSECLRVLKTDEFGVNGVAFDPTGSMLASINLRGMINLWNIATGQIEKIIQTNSIHRNTKVTHILPTDPRHVEDNKFRGKAPFSTNLIFDPTGRSLLVPGSPLSMWDVSSGKLVHNFRHNASSIALHPTEPIIASTASHGEVTFFGFPDTNIPTETLKIDTPGLVYGLAFDPAGKYLLAAGAIGSTRGGTITIIDSKERKLLRILEGHTSVVDWVDISHDGILFGSKSNDDTFRLWRCDTWRPVAVVTEYKDHRRPVPGLAFHPHLPTLATVGSTGRMPRRGISDTDIRTPDSDVTPDTDTHI
jgi:WD40 repeat protein